MPDPDKLFQAAISAVQGVKTPESDQMMVTLQNLVQQGIITPQQLQVALQDRNAFDNITSSPEFAAAQQSALTQLQQIGSEGGMTPIDRAKLQDITDEQNTTARGRTEAVMQNARERGIGGSGLEMASRLQGEQSAADRASRQGTDVAAMAQQRALDAIQGAGEMGGRMQEAEFNREATKAQSQNAIDAANTAMMNQGRMYNTSAANTAQAANLGEKQRVADTNVNTANIQETTNRALPQQVFEDELGKQSAIANAYNQWGQAAAAKKGQKQAFQNQLIAGGLQAAGTAAGTMVGGPIGGAAGGQAASAFAPKHEYQLPGGGGYACGGMVKEDYTDGGVVDGTAQVPGDSPMNDTVDARLSPGELVIPRSLVSEFTKHSTKPKKKGNKVDHEDVAMIFKALASLKGDK